MHEPLRRQLSNLNPVRQAKMKGIRSPVENIAPVAGCVIQYQLGAENRESHSSETPETPVVLSRNLCGDSQHPFQTPGHP